MKKMTIPRFYVIQPNALYGKETRVEGVLLIMSEPARLIVHVWTILRSG